MRRQLALAVGVILLCSVLFVGVGAADDVRGTENTTVTTQPAADTTVEVVYINTNTKETYRFEDADPNLSTLPDGDYLKVTYTRINGTVDKQTREVTISDGKVSTNTESQSGVSTTNVGTDATTEEIELRASVKGGYDYAYSSNETVKIRVGAINTTTPVHKPANKSVTVEIDLPNGTQRVLTTTTTGPDGTTVVEYNLSGHPDGDYDIYLSPASDEYDAFGYASFSAGARALLAEPFGSQAAQFGRNITLGVHTKVGGTVAPNQPVTITIYTPDGSTEIYNVTTGVDGFALQNFTPTQSGLYEIEAVGPNGETSFSEIRVSNYTAQMDIPENYGRYPNETVSLPGTVVNRTGSPLARNTLQLQVTNRSGTVLHTENVTTNAGGQFIGNWTIPANITEDSKDYFIKLTTSTGERIATKEGEIEVELPPSSGGGGGGTGTESNVTVAVQTDQYQYDPSGAVTATIQVTQNGTPVNNTTVSILSTVSGPAIDYRTVQTNTTGQATVTIQFPSSVARYHNKNLRVRAATSVNNTVYVGTAFSELSLFEADIDTSYPATPGETETVTVTARNATGAGQSNVPISYVTLLSGFHTSVIATDTVQTNQTGVAPYTVAIPSDAQGEAQTTFSTRGEDFNSYTVPEVQQYSVNVTVGNQGEYVEVPPGSQVSISFASGETNITSGIVTVSTYDETADNRVLTVETLDEGATATVSIPDVSDRTDYNVRVITINESGVLQSANGYIDVDPQAEPLRDTVTISGTISEADGTPATNDTIATVFEEPTLLDPAQPDGVTSTNNTGYYSVPIWANLTHDIEYYQANPSEVRSTDQVVFPRDNSVDLYAIDHVNTSSNLTISEQLPEGHTLNVTVLDESGDPVENASVTIRHRNGEADAVGTTLTESNGMINVSTAPGIELNGTVDLIVKPPANNSKYPSQKVNDTFTVTNDTNRTYTLNETAESVDVLADTNGSASGTVGSTVTVDVSVRNGSIETTDGSGPNINIADIEVGSFNGSISLTNTSVGAIQNVSVVNATAANVTYGSGNDSVQVSASGLNTSGAEVRVLTLDIQLEQAGSTQVSFSNTTVTTPKGEQYVIDTYASDVFTATDLGPIGQSASAPADIDGDGTFEDINGDGSITEADVQLLFTNRNNKTIQNNTKKFDFSGNGEVNVVDVQALFSQEYLPTQF